VKRYTVARVDGREVRVVDPAHFRAAPAGAKGMGLFCDVDLEPGDCWWPHDWTDRRFVSRVLSWSDYLVLPDNEKRDAEVYGYIDAATRSVVFCAEPFCRVNHARADVANSRTEETGNSVAVVPMPAGTEITIPYDYETLLSLAWKFPVLAARLPARDLTDDASRFRPAVENDIAREFLDRL
jgi:hypothetical protein